MTDEPRQRQCHICQQWVTDYTIDRETLRAGVKSQPICTGCVAYREARSGMAKRTAGNYKRHGTSSEAAASAALTSPQTCAAILRQLCLDDLTPDELASICDINLLTVRPRCSDLRNAGYIKPTGQMRHTDANKKADVLAITDAGRAWLKTVTA